MKQKHISNFNTDSSHSLCSRVQYLKYVKGKHQDHQIAFSKFINLLLTTLLIRMKQVPLLHNTVLILCYEGDILVSVLRKPFEATKAE